MSLQGTTALPAFGQAGSAAPVRLVEEMRLDGNKESFSVVYAIAIGPQNKLAIFFPQESRIAIYSGAGVSVASVGRRGEGPGEFSSGGLQGMRWIGDSLWVNDVLRSRETVISGRGKVIRTVARHGVAEMFAFTAHMRAADGSVIGMSAMLPKDSPKPGVSSVRAANQTLVRKRAVLRVKGDTSSQLLAIVPPADGRWEQPFVYTPQVAYSPVGTMFAFAEVNGMAVRGGTITISAFRARGDTAFVTSFPYAGIPMAPRVVDSLAKSRRPRDADGRPLPLPALDSKRIPPVYVPMRQLVVGSDGRVWAVVRESVDAFKAVAVGERGVASVWFKLPLNARMMAATATHIWLREEDDDGVQSIVRYRFGS